MIPLSVPLLMDFVRSSFLILQVTGMNIQIHLYMFLSKKSLLSTYYISNIVLGAMYKILNKTDVVVTPMSYS